MNGREKRQKARNKQDHHIWTAKIQMAKKMAPKTYELPSDVCSPNMVAQEFKNMTHDPKHSGGIQCHWNSIVVPGFSCEPRLLADNKSSSTNENTQIYTETQVC